MLDVYRLRILTIETDVVGSVRKPRWLVWGSVRRLLLRTGGTKHLLR